jgi:hypothetical protein
VVDRFSQLGTSYSKIGLGTNSELVARRLGAIKKVPTKIEVGNIFAAVRCAFGLAYDLQELEWLIAPIRDDDPTFAPEVKNRELSLVAAAVLRDNLERPQYSRLVAFAIGVAAFGGMRSIESDDALCADSANAVKQVQLTRPALEELAIQKKLVDADLASIETHAQNFPEAQKSIRNAIGSEFEAIRSVSAKVNEISTALRLLQEEAGIQWWAFSTWSYDSRISFSKFEKLEAAVRSGKELADLTGALPGPMSAPALLDMVIAKDRKSESKKYKIYEYAAAADKEWRNIWSEGAHNLGNNAALVPMLSATSLSVESEDEDDWHARFRRITGIEASASLSPLDAGLQIYRELLLIREMQ